jgi:hypothetical protein
MSRRKTLGVIDGHPGVVGPNIVTSAQKPSSSRLFFEAARGLI